MPPTTAAITAPNLAQTDGATRAPPTNVIAFPRVPTFAQRAPSFGGDAPEQASEPAASPTTFKITTAANSYAKQWTEREATLESLLELIAERDVRDSKEGFCFTPATLLGGKRNARSVDEISMLVFDIDGEQTVDDVVAILEKLGCQAYLYTSHSHMTTQSDVVVDDYESWAKRQKKAQTPTLESMSEYLVFKKKGYLKNVKFDPNNCERVADKGNCYRLTHEPVHKLRVIFPLAQPIKISALAASNTRALEIYVSIYEGVGNALGFNYDPTCSDPCKLYYMPSVPQHMAEHIDQRVVEGPLLDYRNFARAEVKSGAKTASTVSGKTEGDKKPPLIVDGFNYGNWPPHFDSAQYPIDVEGLVETHLPEEILGQRANGGYIIRCPYEAEHTTPGGQGTFCANGDEKHGWNIYCSHASCQGAERGRMDFVAEWVRNEKASRTDLEGFSGHGFKRAGARTATEPSEDGDWVLPDSGAFVVPYGQVGNALNQMNDRWSVVPIGSRTRYAHIRHDGNAEFFDKTNFSNLFEASKYQVPAKFDKKGKPIAFDLEPFIPLWLQWEHRRQYSGYGFFPGGNAPPGHYNIWRGFNVEPKQGDWSLLRAHVFDNVCQGNQEYFDWLMAWLAQMFQHPEIKPGTHLVLTGSEGVGKSKLGEWIIKALKPCAMTLTSGERLVGRFNGHFESLLFAMAEEVFWAGDRQAEGVIKALATANEMDYERKGLDAEPGLNYTRMMIASNNPWVVPAWSGGRRWFVLEVGNKQEQNREYFAAIDKQMDNGGLAAMVYDLLHSPLPSHINVRKVPVTPWLIEQRQHSADPKRVWLRDAIERGEFSGGYFEESVALSETDPSVLLRSDVRISAERYFERRGCPATESMVGQWLTKELGTLLFKEGPRLTGQKNGKRTRPRSWEFAPLSDLRAHWLAKYGETLADTVDHECEATE